MWDRHSNNIKSSLNSSSEFSGLLLLNQKSEGSLLFRGTVILLVYIRVSSLFSLISIYITLDVHLSFNLSIFVKFYIQENTWILKATMTINIKSMTSKLVNYAVLKWKSVYNEENSYFFFFWLIAQLLCMMLWYSTYGTISATQNAFDMLSYLLTPFEQFLSDQGVVSAFAHLFVGMVDVSSLSWCFRYVFGLNVSYLCIPNNVVTCIVCLCSEILKSVFWK